MAIYIHIHIYIRPTCVDGFQYNASALAFSQLAAFNRFVVLFFPLAWDALPQIYSLSLCCVGKVEHRTNNVNVTIYININITTLTLQESATILIHSDGI